MCLGPYVWDLPRGIGRRTTCVWGAQTCTHLEPRTNQLYAPMEPSTRCWHTRNWKDKLRIWVKPTGWRPTDVAQKRPLQTIKDVHHFEKYAPTTSNNLSYWALFHLLATLGLLLQMLYNFASLKSAQLMAIGFALFIAVFGYTSVMDGKKWALRFEQMRSFLTFGWALLVLQQDANVYLPWLVYGGLSGLLAVYLAFKKQ